MLYIYIYIFADAFTLDMNSEPNMMRLSRQPVKTCSPMQHQYHGLSSNKVVMTFRLPNLRPSRIERMRETLRLAQPQMPPPFPKLKVPVA